MNITQWMKNAKGSFTVIIPRLKTLSVVLSIVRLLGNLGGILLLKNTGHFDLLAEMRGAEWAVCDCQQEGCDFPAERFCRMVIAKGSAEYSKMLSTHPSSVIMVVYLHFLRLILLDSWGHSPPGLVAPVSDVKIGKQQQYPLCQRIIMKLSR